MKIAIATDHTGYEDLAKLKDYLESQGHQLEDYGPDSLNPDDDYPDYMIPAAKAVASGQCEVGILLGGSGEGEAMAANRIVGARCAVFYGPATPKSAVDAEGDKSNDPYEIVKLSREHNNANLLSLAVRFLSFEEIKMAVDVWLNTAFSGVEHHIRRIKKLDELK